MNNEKKEEETITRKYNKKINLQFGFDQIFLRLLFKKKKEKQDKLCFNLWTKQGNQFV